MTTASAVCTRTTVLIVAFAILLAAIGSFAPPAGAADRIYWTNNGATDSISWANLDGSGGGDLYPTTATVSDPQGVAIDAAAGKIYWANGGTDSISWANLDGSGDGDLNTTGANLGTPEGVAIDPAAGRIYWGNAKTGALISYARLDGTGGGDLNVAGAKVGDPHGVAIDPAAGLLYWAANAGTDLHDDRISAARLDGSGGFDLPIYSDHEPRDPYGLAISPGENLVYWSNTNGGMFSEIAVACVCGGPADFLAAPVFYPHGLAIDPAGEKVYWANMSAAQFQFRPLYSTGSDSGVIATTGATMSGASFPVLLKAPTGTGAPTIGGSSAVGSRLSCSDGTWAHDESGSFLYQVPRSFAYQWTRDGADIPGASSRSLTATAAGDYRCRVTAQNDAGSTSQTSAAHSVDAPAAPAAPQSGSLPSGEPAAPAGPPPSVSPTDPIAPSSAFTFGKLKLDRKKGTARLAVVVPGPGTVTLAGKDIARTRPARTTSRGTVFLSVKAVGRAKKRLNNTGTAWVKVTVTYTPTAGSPNRQVRRLKLKRKR